MGIEKSKAELVRKKLLEAKILDKKLKPIAEQELIFFPIVKRTNEVDELLKGLNCKIIQKKFPKTKQFQSFEEKIKLTCSKYGNWKNPIKFDLLGDIALLRIDTKETSLAFRQCIAKEILKKYPKIKSVRNKISEVEGEIRVFESEILAGHTNSQTCHVEYGLKIIIDIEKAYFNSRLAQEHRRIATIVKDNELILDMFAGVGPFSLHCAQNKKVRVIAIDINPIAMECLKKSILLNRLVGEIYPIIGDSQYVFLQNNLFDHIIMNLPGNSLQHLNLASKLVRTGGQIHLYCFSHKKEDSLTNMLSSIRKIIERPFKVLTAFKSRDVSPSKVQFNIDLQIL